MLALGICNRDSIFGFGNLTSTFPHQPKVDYELEYKFYKNKKMEKDKREK